MDHPPHPRGGWSTPRRVTHWGLIAAFAVLGVWGERTGRYDDDDPWVEILGGVIIAALILNGAQGLASIRRNRRQEKEGNRP